MTDRTLHSLPLFPLGTVLFPGGRLPLRVFEVRYLDLVGKCQRTGAPFGVVALRQGQEVRHPGAPLEHLESIGTLAHIDALEQVQPGLLLIECRGTERFRIDHSERLRHGLWIADVTVLPPEPALPVPSDLEHTAQALRRVHAGLRRGPSTLPVPTAGSEHFEDCGWVANRWCELLPLPLALKQRLLGLDSPLLRLELVSDLLERAGIDGDAG
ncbi:MAG TPA: LON peptidase substrate-binding domain-containing protein [Ottowia sp.]|uniref:LON peptidase substrate-binding domain-containing protein n=1 Tax=Ottowia sp. TaxID=1898956 RepID=UPI002CE9273C|nr:LON peptidase substrate-binding domain-containing protein [Ottowia sp.]HMN20554.1 LON peptidase substrate-binding domain-containing protein [Ottowia sp.]